LICGIGIPAWINRLAHTITCLPFVEKCLPKELLTAVAVQQTVQEHFEAEQDESELTELNNLLSKKKQIFNYKFN
jgi:PPPDE peptidase domain-containing protein 1